MTGYNLGIIEILYGFAIEILENKTTYIALIKFLRRLNAFYATILKSEFGCLIRIFQPLHK